MPKRTLIILGLLALVFVIYLVSNGKPLDIAKSTEKTQCRVTVTADQLNVRAEPNANAPIVETVRKDTQTDAEKTVQNGFRKLGENRWASDTFLAPMNGRDCG